MLPTDVVANDAAHPDAHNLLHEFYNGALQDYGGIVYVSADGSDGNSGRSWTLPKATIAAAQGVSGDKAQILVGPGQYLINEPIELADAQYIRGAGPNTTLGTQLKATAGLGANPIFANASGNLTSGGLSYMQLRGTEDGSGGAGIHIANAAIADGYLFDYLRIQGFGSHGIWVDATGSETAGNPLFWGVLEMYSCGLGDNGFGLYLGNAHAGTIRIGYLGGDNCQGGLLRIATMNNQGYVRVDNLKAERTVSGRMTNIVHVTNSGGGLGIGGFRIFHNVSGGVDANAFILSDSTALRFTVDHTFYTNSGSNQYAWGYTDGTDTIARDDFLLSTIISKNEGIRLRHNTGIFVRKGSPEGVFNANPGAIAMDRTNGKLYVKGSGGSGNTGWLEVATV